MKFQTAIKSVFVIYLLCLFSIGRVEAANLFRDVPADHWAYDVLDELHSHGIVQGFGDNSYRGNRNMTRYEMAQITARAMACATDKRDKDLIDRLCAEFQEELKDLGVRVKYVKKRRRLCQHGIFQGTESNGDAQGGSGSACYGS